MGPDPFRRRAQARKAPGGAAAPKAALPSRMLEVDVFAGRLEIMERYGDGHAAALAEELARLGLPARLSFRAPCG